MRIVIEDEVVSVETPEGKTVTMPVSEFSRKLADESFDTAGLIVPDGVVGLLPMQGGVVVVHQTTPCLRLLRWIAEDSPKPFGPDARYRDVCLALPFVVVLAVFLRDPRGRLQLTSHSEAFFRKEPLRAKSDELFFPALLNCSRMEPAEGRPLSWICVQNLNVGRACRGARDDTESLHAGLGALLSHLYETSFNRSSEVHEGSSWFAETVKSDVDPRLASVEAWERASLEDASFATEVPWLPTGLGVGQMADRIAGIMGRRRQPMTAANDLARLVINRPTTSRRRRLQKLIEQDPSE